VAESGWLMAKGLWQRAKGSVMFAGPQRSLRTANNVEIASLKPYGKPGGLPGL